MSMRLLRFAVFGLTGLQALAAPASDAPRTRIVFQGGGPTQSQLFLADADGEDERPLLPSESRDYNPTYSPDGRWIVFTSDRDGSPDLYRVHPDGSSLERLTDSSAFDDQGALSPDGRTVAFVSTRGGGTANLWLLDLARRKATPLTRNRSGNFRPSWSPDGRWIAFTSDRDGPHERSGPDEPPPRGSGCCGWELKQFTALYVVRVDGKALRRLTPPDGYAGSPEWSPDGKRIAFYDERGQIATIDVDSGVRTPITNDPGRRWWPQFGAGGTVRFLAAADGGQRLAASDGSHGPVRKDLWSPSWSPDGTRVVYARGDWRFDPAPLAARRVRSPDERFEFERAAATLSYSPDGRRVLLARPFDGESRLEVMNVDGSERRTLHDTNDAAKGIVYPVWTPDGASIVFTIGPYGKRNPVTPAQLMIIRADGTGLRPLTEGAAGNGFPSFSPDGRRFVYRVLGTETGLRVFDLASGVVTKLTDKVDNFPAWSPRGDRILFTSLRTGDFEMYTVRPDGRGLKQLTHDRGNDAHGQWSPDGRQIVFTSTRAGWKDETRLPSNDIQSNGELDLMDADGSHRHPLTDDQWEQAVTAWLPAGR